MFCRGIKAWAVSSAGCFYLHDPNDSAQLRPTTHGCGCEGVASPESLEFRGAPITASLLPLLHSCSHSGSRRCRLTANEHASDRVFRVC